MSRSFHTLGGLRTSPPSSLWGSRRGVELSMNMIIIIVLVLIIAAIIIYLVAKNSALFSTETNSCASKGGQCKTECDPGESGSAFFTGGCGEGELCCSVPLKSGDE